MNRLCEVCDDTPVELRCDVCKMELCYPCDRELHRPVKVAYHHRVVCGLNAFGPMDPKMYGASSICAVGRTTIPERTILSTNTIATPHRCQPSMYQTQTNGNATPTPAAPARIPTPTEELICELCEDNPAAARYPEYGENYCSICDEALHAPIRMSSHERVQIPSWRPTITTPVDTGPAASMSMDDIARMRNGESAAENAAGPGPPEGSSCKLE